jgi:hypothetical protein
MKLRRTAVAAAVTLTLGLAACGSDDSDTSADTTPSPSVEETEDAEEAPESQTLPVDLTITDDVLGDTIRVTQMVRDFQPTEGGGSIVEDGGEFVLLELDLAAGDQFSGGIQGGWKLVGTDGELAGSSTSIVDADMEAAGFTPLEEPSSGETAKGWVAFQINTREDAYQFEYKRLAAKVIGQDTEIPEKIWTEPLPTA